MKIGSGNSIHRRARGGGIPKGSWAPHDDPSDTGWADPATEINQQKNCIPILVNVLQHWEDDGEGGRRLSDKSYGITKETISAMISDVNTMLQGTYQAKDDNVNMGFSGRVIDDPLHGTATNFSVKLADYIPVNYFDNWLYRHDYAVKTPVQTAANTVTGGAGVKTPISFDIQNITTGGNSSYQSDFNSAKGNLKDARTKAADNYTTYTNQDMLDLKNYGGLVKTDGIFYYDIEEYYNPTVLAKARTDVGDADSTAANDDDPFKALYSSFSANRTPYTADWNNDDRYDWQPCMDHATNAFPGFVLWIYDFGNHIRYGLGGNANFTEWDSSGTMHVEGSKPDLVNLDDEDEYNNERRYVANIILHELGHILDLRHTFEVNLSELRPRIISGSRVDMTIPVVQCPAVNQEITTSDTLQVSSNTTKNVERFNTLSSDEKTFIEFFYKKWLPSFTRGTRYVDLKDETKNFSTRMAFHRTTYTDPNDGSTTLVKSINTDENSWWDMTIGGVSDWYTLYDIYGLDGIEYALKRLSMGIDHSIDLPFWWTGSVHDTITADNPWGSGTFGGGKQLVFNKTDSSGNLMVNVVNGADGRTRIPFCIPNPDGTPSNDYDEFWMYNMNWLNPDYPPYPNDWPTSKVYDQYEADGSTPLCPCLYAAQTYSNTWVPGTAIQASDVKTTAGVDSSTGNRLLTPVNKTITDATAKKREWRNMMVYFFHQRNDDSVNYTSNSYMKRVYSNNQPILASGKAKSVLYPMTQLKQNDVWGNTQYISTKNTRWFRTANNQDSMSMYWSNYTVPYEGGNSQQNSVQTLRAVSTKNGFMPEFGFYGIGSRTYPPTDYIFTHNAINNSTPLTTNFPRALKYIGQSITTCNNKFTHRGYNNKAAHLPLHIRAFAGSNNPNSDFYNPFKIDMEGAPAKEYYGNNSGYGEYYLPARYMTDGIIHGFGITKNPLHGFEWKGNPLTAGDLRNAMNYKRKMSFIDYSGKFFFDVTDLDFFKNEYNSNKSSNSALIGTQFKSDDADMDELNDAWVNSYKNGTTPNSNFGIIEGRNAYTTSQIQKAENSIDADRGKLLGALRFGQLLSKYHADIETDYGGYDAQTIKTAIENYLKV